MTDPTKSVFDQVRADARKDGWWQGRQVAGMELDEAEERGYREAESEAPRRWVWFCFGFLFAALIFAMLETLT